MKKQKFIGATASAILALSLSLSAIADGAKGAAPALSVESSISDLLANPKSKVIVEKYLPDLSKSEHLSMIESMSLQDLSSIPQANIDDTKLKAIQAELSQIK